MTKPSVFSPRHLRRRAPFAVGAGTLCLLAWIPLANLGAQQTGEILGTVTDSVRGAALAHATIVAIREATADARPYATRTDGHGGFELAGVPPGRYEVDIEHSWMDSAGITPFAAEVDVKAGRPATARLATPSFRTLRRLLCGTALGDSGTTAMVMGSVRVAAGDARVAGARVVAAWNDIGFDARTRRVINRPRGIAVRTDQTGFYRICGLPAAQTLSLQAQLDSTHYSGLVETAIPAGAVYVRTFLVDPVHAATATEGHGVVVGVVVGTDGRAVPNARLSEWDGSRTTSADSSGHFRLTGLRDGTQAIDVTALGFYPTRVPVDIGAAVVKDTIRMQAVAVVLQAVKTTAARQYSMQRIEMIAPGFALRRRQGFGVFFTADSIEKVNPVFTSDLFRQALGFGVAPDQSVYSLRPSGGLNQGYHCEPDLYLDGAQVDAGDVDLVAPNDVLAIEAYQAGEPSPVQFAAHACGVILIWTK